MVILLNNLTAKQAQDYGLVLSAMRIHFDVRASGQAWDILVRVEDYEKALYAVEKYKIENPQAEVSEAAISETYQKTYSGIWAAILLLVWHAAIQYSRDSKLIVRTFSASAEHILRGELYRSATALMIHGDALHLMANMVGIALFGTVVCSITGYGAGWLIILMCGIVGNILNAVLFQAHHVSIGASTAVFGAVGIMSAHQFLKKIKRHGQRARAFLPLAAGLALLAFLGSSRHTDVTAHLFGFAAGILIGCLYTVYVKHPLSKNGQFYCFAAAAGLMAVCWVGYG